MEFEDSRYALFPEPNAYVQKIEKKEKCEPKKIVFQEPYEQLPNFYINNSFAKHGCDCISHNQNINQNRNNHDCNCNHGNNNKHFLTKNKNPNRPDYKDSCNHDNLARKNAFRFDLKSLLPILSMFNKSGGVDLSSLVGLLNNGNNSEQGENNTNPMSLISSLMSNKDMMSGILNLFKGGGLNLFRKKQTTKKELKTTDFEIKNYTRVE